MTANICRSNLLSQNIIFISTAKSYIYDKHILYYKHFVKIAQECMFMVKSHEACLYIKSHVANLYNMQIAECI